MYNEKITERMALVATIDPASLAAQAHNTDVVDMKHVRRLVFHIITGTLGANATVDFDINGDTASNGAFATKITGKSIAQVVKASGDNVQVSIEVSAEEVAAQGFRYVRGTLTIGAAASIVGVVGLADFLRYSSGSENDLASVTVT